MQADRDIVCPSKHQWKRRCLSTSRIIRAAHIAQLDVTAQLPLLSAAPLHQALHRCRICQSYFSCWPWNFKPQGTRIGWTISGTMGNFIVNWFVSWHFMHFISWYCNTFHVRRILYSIKIELSFLRRSGFRSWATQTHHVIYRLQDLSNRLLQDLSSLPVPPEPETGAFELISSYFIQ